MGIEVNWILYVLFKVGSLYSRCFVLVKCGYGGMLDCVVRFLDEKFRFVYVFFRFLNVGYFCLYF